MTAVKIYGYRDDFYDIFVFPKHTSAEEDKLMLSQKFNEILAKHEQKEWDYKDCMNDVVKWLRDSKEEFMTINQNEIVSSQIV